MLSKEQENQEYICYIGSATDLNTRYNIHKTNSTRSSEKKNLETPFYASLRNLGWKNFIWRPIVITTNHYAEFFKTNLEVISALR